MTTTDPRAADPDPPTRDPPTRDPPTVRAVLPAAAAYVAAWLAGLAVLPEAVDAHADAGSIGRYLVAHAGAAVLQSWLVHGVAAVALVWFVRSALAVLGRDEARPPALHRLTRGRPSGPARRPCCRSCSCTRRCSARGQGPTARPPGGSTP